MLKKIGIITHYYKSTNYGGILQSYALCRYLNENGCESKQICYDSMKYPLKFRIKHFIAYFYIQLKNIFHPIIFIKILKRKRALLSFGRRIPHTDKVFSDKNLSEVNKLFDYFITGSDQVWHPSVINVGYSLSFTDKPKFSYAASIASDTIPDIKRPYYDRILKSFDSISVRERKAQELLNNNAELVLDPVFLLSEEDWNALASKRIVNDNYIFCYFLGDSKEARDAAIEFSHMNNLKIVHIPYLSNKYRKCDNFGDFPISDVSPCDFLSLIINANYVLTDSFHAISFSFILKKQFFVFKRNSRSVMGSRISDILYTLNLKNRYYDNPCDILTNKIDEIDYREKRSAFEALKAKSFDYIDLIIGCGDCE